MKVNDLKGWCKRHRTAISASLLCFLLVILIYLWRVQLQSYGIWLTFNEAIQAIGQFATVGAFIIGFDQLRKNKKQTVEQAEKERQLIFFNEAKIQINKMSSAIRQLQLSEGESSVIKICNLIDVLANLGSNQTHIYDSMKAGVEKEIIDIYWQDMFWIDLAPTLNNIQLKGLFRKQPEMATMGDAINFARQQQLDRQHDKSHKDYHYEKNMLRRLRPYIAYGDILAIKDSKSSFELFRIYYFDDEYTSKYLSRIATKPDFKAHVPVLAALYHHFIDEHKLGED